MERMVNRWVMGHKQSLTCGEGEPILLFQEGC